MARGRPKTSEANRVLNNQRGKFVVEYNPGEANPKQRAFFEARAPFIAYGGAKGGGKGHAVNFSRADAVEMRRAYAAYSDYAEP